MSNSNLILTSAPHITTKSKLESIMYDVVIALLPAAGLSIYMFGWSALYVIISTIVSGLLLEAASLYIRKQPHILKTTLDGSAIVTLLLLALNLPPSAPFWLIFAGSFVAIVITKHSFGGVGYNIFNPALVARIFLLISFPVQMTKWNKPTGFADAETIATPLDILKTEGLEKVLQTHSLSDMFFGTMGGSLGEMSAAALLIGAVYLLARRVISWHIPISTLAGLFVFTGVFWLVDPSKYMSPLMHILAGGAILGAFFMATDMVASPLSKKGQLIYGVAIGVITAIIRMFGGYPEGISFAIVIMNAFAPIIDKYSKPKKFGTK